VASKKKKPTPAKVLVGEAGPETVVPAKKAKASAKAKAPAKKAKAPEAGASAEKGDLVEVQDPPTGLRGIFVMRGDHEDEEGHVLITAPGEEAPVMRIARTSITRWFRANQQPEAASEGDSTDGTE
jgi:hypothetical protein